MPLSRRNQVVDSRIDAISYNNFKNTVTDDDLHEMYMDFWNTHRHYQEQDLPERHLDRSGPSASGPGDVAETKSEDMKRKGKAKR